MLRHRVATAFVLLGLVLGAVFGLPSIGFRVFLALVIGCAIWEWAALAGLSGNLARSAYLVSCLVLMLVIGQYAFLYEATLLAGLAFWLLALAWICIYPRGQSAWGNDNVLRLIGLLLFVPGWLGFIDLREQGNYIFHLLLLPALVSAADIGAYFSGRAFGRHKLAPQVSPNKTWEGVFGGMLACALLIVVVGWLGIRQVTSLAPVQWMLLVGAALVIAVFSVIGDLFESMVKRFRNVKDSGNLLPGHGGVLDRIDGLTAAAPLYALLLNMLEPVLA